MLESEGAAGIALRNAGIDAQVFERSRELREIGAGLMIWPNGTRSLEALGVELRGTAVRKITFRDWRGRHLFDTPVDEISERYGSEVAFVHRADLQMALAKSFGSDGLRLGAEVTGFVEDRDQVTVTLGDRTIASGAILVGADGLRSHVRRQLLGDGDPVYLGSTIWRGIVSSQGMPLERGHGVNWIGRGSEFLAFYLADDRIDWACVTKKPKGERSGPGGHKHDVLERFGHWVTPVQAPTGATDDPATLRNDMFDRPPDRHWSRGRITLVGDAAHPMTPNSGQDACQALEDAVVLAESLEREPDVASAFDTYEGRRLRRNRVVAAARQATRVCRLTIRCCARFGMASQACPQKGSAEDVRCDSGSAAPTGPVKPRDGHEG